MSIEEIDDIYDVTDKQVAEILCAKMKLADKELWDEALANKFNPICEFARYHFGIFMKQTELDGEDDENMLEPTPRFIGDEWGTLADLPESVVIGEQEFTKKEIETTIRLSNSNLRRD
tara:strand:+ start:1775 stop:2128 length:354 start_codon:yes stop_codon:yes gene_type:complete